MNRSKARGTAAETAVVNYLRANGFPLAERLALHGGKDIGDIRACPGLCVEVKAHATVTDGDLRTWQAETTKEKANGHASIMWLVVKRPGKAQPAQWMCWEADRSGYWAMMWLSDAVDKARRSGWGDPVDA